MKFEKKKPETGEVFNFKNEECQQALFDASSETSKLSECFSTDQPFLVQAKRWNKELNNIFHLRLKKVRVIEGKPKETEISNLLEERKSLKIHIANCTEDKREDLEESFKDIENLIEKETAEQNLQKVMENFGSFAKSDGFVNTNGMWNVKKRVFPKTAKIAPTAKKIISGQIETNQDNLKKLYLETYKHRPRNRPIRCDLNDLKYMKESLFNLRLEFVKLVKSKPWTKTQLRVV